MRRPQAARLALAALAVSFCLFAARFFLYHWAHSVDLLFWDQWDFYEAVFSPHSLWQQFRWQHGPTRMGLWVLVFHLVVAPSRWSTRAEVMAMCAIQALSCLGFLWLKRRLKAGWQASDCVVPCLFFTLVSYTTFLAIPNPAHGVLPLSLLIALALAWTIESPRARLAAVVVVNLALVSTGFGFLAGFVVLPLLLWELRRAPGPAEARLQALALAAALLSLVLFFAGYRFSPANDSFQWIHPRLWQYPAFAAVMAYRFAAVSRHPAWLLCGAAALAGVLAVLGADAAARLRGRPAPGLERRQAAVLLLLAGSSAAFAAAAAYGRVSLGLFEAGSSRYAVYLIPGAAALLLYLQLTARSRARRALLAGLAVLAVASELQRPIPQDRAYADALTAAKREWVRAYRSRPDADAAARATGFYPHPRPAQTRLQQKLDQLQARRLSFFADPAR
ncbi:MAG: hypothetical protein HY926_01930 [Elusimicrobia bacterium]|nr:hypothetical protein [Elusimicrobiota bacterium]